MYVMTVTKKSVCVELGWSWRDRNKQSRNQCINADSHGKTWKFKKNIFAKKNLQMHVTDGYQLAD